MFRSQPTPRHRSVPERGRYKRWLTLAFSVLLALTGVVAVEVLPAPAASAATANTCSFATAGTGTFARTICWFDFSGYDASQASSAGGQAFTTTLPGGYTLSFTVTTTGGAIAAVPFPTWSGAYLGNNGHYTGVGGRPALYQTSSGTTTTSTIGNIVLKDPGGTVRQGFALVGADAESTDSGEYLQWQSNQNIRSLTQSPSGNGLGNACGGGFTGIGTTTVLCTGSATGTKTGTAIVAADNPTYFTQTMKGSGLEGFAFGVQVSKIQFNKTVVNEFAGDNFGINITDSNGVVAGSGNTNGTASATTNEITVLSTGAGSQYTFSETATSGQISNYTQSWSCQRNGAADTSIPATSGTSATSVLNLGDFLDCTLTNTAKPTGLSIVKTAGTPVDVNGNGITDAGDTIPYTFTVTNTGQLPMQNVAISDPKVGPVTCPSTTLAAGVSEPCGPVDYTVTSADANAGNVHNSATVSGTVVGTTTTVTSTPSTTDTTAENPDPSISLVKTGNPPAASTAGDNITFTYVATNTGNVTLTGVAIAEGTFTGTGTLSPLSCTQPVALAPDAQLICTATYTLTQADVDSRHLVNNASVSGTPPNGAPDVNATAQFSTPTPASPALTLSKTAAPTTVTAPGQQVTYSFLVSNSGNVTMSNIAVTEGAFNGSGALSAVLCPLTTLVPGQKTTCTATYTTTQADIDNRTTLTNTASVTGTPPGSTTPIPPTSSTANVTVAPTPSLTVAKTASPTTVNRAGQQVTYTFAVTNTGGVTLSNLAINETSFTGGGTVPVATCDASSLAAGASTTCRATYMTVQADIDNRGFDNTATAQGTAPRASTPTVSGPSSAHVAATASPAITLTKTARPTQVSTAGTAIQYSFLITNTGNVTLNGVSVTEGAFSGSGSLSVVNCPVTALAPGADTVCTANYTTTQQDLDAGVTLTNTATASGYAPGATTATTSAPASSDVTVQDSPSVTLAKSVSPTVVSAAGTQVTYSFLVTNNGNVTLNGVAITEQSFNGSGTMSGVNCPATTLAPAASTTCTATYRLTQPDIDHGGVTNTAVAVATPAGATSPITSSSSTATVSSTNGPSLTVTKSVDSGVASGPNQQVTYSFVVTNTGNRTLQNLAVAETGFSGSGSTPVVTCPATTLAPGAKTTCLGTYLITDADADNGTITDTATATATPVGGSTPISATSNVATVTIPQAPALSVVKSVVPSDAASFTVGRVLTYSFVVTNNGNVTINGVNVDDSAFSGSGGAPTVTCPPAAASLAAGVQVTCTATYTITQQDLDAGHITNMATASGIPTRGTSPITSGPSTAVVPADQTPSIALSKVAVPSNPTAAGQTITYQFVVTNTGNVSVHGVDVTEESTTGTGTVSAIGCDVSTLLPGGQAHCTATYVLTQQDADAGRVVNTAGATALSPSDTTITAEDASATLTVTARPSLTVVKSADPTTVIGLGAQVTYTFHVVNTGNVTLSGIGVTDVDFTGTGRLSPIACSSAPIAPGGSVDCTATYTTTQADVDAGSVTNSAIAHGTPPGSSTPVDSPISPPATVTISSSAALALVKTATPQTIIAAGARISYSFLVTNTGTISLSSIAITETTFTGSGAVPTVVCPAAAALLAPGAVVTCTATYTATEADVRAGSISNTATASGTALGQTVTSDPSTARVSVNVPPAAGGLPFTGVRSGLDLAIAVALLAAGALMVLIGRRRQS